MAGLGKKILSAFVEVTEKKETVTTKPADATTTHSTSNPTTPGVPGTAGRADTTDPAVAVAGSRRPDSIRPSDDNRYAGHFDKLFSESNIPGPDYYEFSKMIEAMQAIADEQARYYAAYAGLQVQGLDKGRLLSTASEYLRILDNDATQFHVTVNAAMQEKVKGRQDELDEKTRRIISLTREISELQEQVSALQAAIKENGEKINAGARGYDAENGKRKDQILADIEKIKHYIH